MRRHPLALSRPTRCSSWERLCGKRFGARMRTSGCAKPRSTPIQVPTCVGSDDDLSGCGALLSRLRAPGSWMIQAKFLLDNNDGVKSGTGGYCGILANVGGTVDVVRTPSLNVTGLAGEAEVVTWPACSRLPSRPPCRCAATSRRARTSKSRTSRSRRCRSRVSSAHSRHGVRAPSGHTSRATPPQAAQEVVRGEAPPRAPRSCACSGARAQARSASSSGEIVASTPASAKRRRTFPALLAAQALVTTSPPRSVTSA